MQRPIKNHKKAALGSKRSLVHGAQFLLIFVCLLLPALPALAVQYLNYSGRLTNANGSPLAGPVELEIRFYHEQSGGHAVGPTLKFSAIPLVNGIFTVDLKLTPSEVETVFDNGVQAAYTEVTADAKTYPRQRLLPIPLALRVPVDNLTTEFSQDGLLSVKTIPISKVEGLGGILGASAALKGAAGSTMDGYLSQLDWQRFDGKQDSLTTNSTLNVARVFTTGNDAITISPFSTSSGSTGELRFQELAATGTNYVGFKAPNSIGSSMIWTLPAVDGSNGQVLSTNGSGTLGWFTPKLGTVTSVNTGSGLSGGPITVTGLISLSNTTVIPGYYPRANISVDSHGRITSATQGADVDLTSEVYGILPINRGGTGSAVTPANGQLPIGNGGGYSVSTLTQGTGINIDNRAGGITIHLANTQVTPNTYTRANITVDQQGRITAASPGASIDLTSEVSGTLPIN